jgi:hydroxyacylglutathione hydrolase
MSTFVVVALLLGVLLGVAVRMLAGGGYRSVSPSVGADLLQDRNVFLLDVRTKGEYGLGRIPGASLVPISALEVGLDRIPVDRPLLIYCASGFRSRLAARRLVKHSRQPVYNLTGGIQAWQRSGLPVEK